MGCTRETERNSGVVSGDFTLTPVPRAGSEAFTHSVANIHDMNDSDPEPDDTAGSRDRGGRPEDGGERAADAPEGGRHDSEASNRPDETDEHRDPEELRRAVEEKYDWEDFGPREMQEMSPEEWDVAFDPDAWVTGPELLDRVEDDLLRRVAERDVFAVIEREVEDGEEVLVAYADEGFAVVYQDGTVTGSGTVLRDVKPTVALCSMPDYEVRAPPEDAGLPDPEDVPEGSGALGHSLLQAIGIAQLLFGAVLFVMPFTYDPVVNGCPSVPGSEAHLCTFAGQELVLFPLGSSGIMAAMAGIAFVVFGVFMLVIVANARLSDRFRAQEFRDRLRASGVGNSERPSYVSDDEED